MDSFATWVLRGLSEKQEKSRLSQISDLIDWVPIRQILDEMYDNNSEKGGRPNCDVILMFKILILQQWFCLNDLEIEGKWPIAYHLCHFSVFLIQSRILVRYGYSKNAWLKLEKIKWSGQSFKDSSIRWVYASSVERFKMPHFIEADPGSSKKPHNEGSETRRSRDGTWAKKGKKSYFGISFIKKPILITV
jgi:transposase, IS5 family